MATKRIQATIGDYAGRHLDLDEADADQAIKDGWARDPYAPPSDEPVKEVDREKAAEAAAKALRRMRGEEEPPKARKAEAAKAETAATTSARSLEAEDPAGGYETRSAPKKTK